MKVRKCNSKNKKFLFRYFKRLLLCPCMQASLKCRLVQQEIKEVALLLNDQGSFSALFGY